MALEVHGQQFATLTKFRQPVFRLSGRGKLGQNGETDAMTNRVREFRRKAGLTQEALAERAGLSFGYLSRIERGERTLSQKRAQALAAVLQTNWVTLMSPPPTGFSDAEPDFTPAPPIASHPEPDPDEVLATIQEAVAAALTDLRLPNTQSDILRVSRAVERDIRAIDGIASFPATLDLRLSEAMTKLHQKWQAAKASL
jgi:transcriptional regulator with XRE-family HTH domain